MKIDFEPLPADTLAAYKRMRERRIAEANHRAVARSLGILSAIERVEAEPIPSMELELCKP